MTRLSFRVLQVFNALIALMVLSAVFYSQYVMGLVPCPLCFMQRICVFLLLVIIVVSFRAKARIHLMSFLQLLVVGAGLFFALRQLWLQSLPPESVPACMPGLDILVHYFPWQTVAHSLLWGTGDCAAVTWRFWGISMAGWSALYFGFMVLMGMILFSGTRGSSFNTKNPIIG